MEIIVQNVLIYSDEYNFCKYRSDSIGCGSI